MRRTVLLLASTALVVLLASGVAWAVTLAFAPAKNYPAGDGVWEVAAGDLDGDGDSDLATASSSTGKVSVLIRRADGTFKAPLKYAADGATDVIVREDLDGDGDRDLATANWVSADGLSYVSVRLGRGDGTFGAQRRYPAGAVGPVAIESGDLDGDGDKDLVTANQASETVSVFKNNGAGAFAPGRAFDAGSAGAPVDVDRSDLDGDGDGDLALADEDVGDDAGGVAVLLNAGDGTFGTSRGFTTPQTTGEAVLAKDLDGDGDPDLTTADSVRGQVDVWENGGDGSFALGGTYPVYGGQSPPYRVPPHALTEADFDGDGDTDIATANGRSNNVSVLLNAGDGTLGNERVFGTGGSSGDLTRARMNADSRPDLVVTRSAKNVSVLLNTTK